METILEKIRKNGYKLTRPRQAILKLLTETAEPMSARAIKSRLDSVDLVSVYRNLKIFRELDLINAEQFGGEDRYCLALHPHHHVVCERCGYTESIECKHKFTHNNFADIKHKLTLSGVCRKCQKICRQ